MPSPTQRNFTSTAQPTFLTLYAAAGDTLIQVNDFVGYPATPFTAVLDRGKPVEEVIQVTGVSGLNLTVVRGVDGTTASPHDFNCSFEHDASARDFNDANTHIMDAFAPGSTSAYHLGSRNIVASNIALNTITGSELSNTLSLGGSLSVSGATTLSSDLSVGQARFHGDSRSISNAVGDTVEIGNVALPDGSGTISIAVAYHVSGISVTKYYILPIAYNQTAGGWTVATPTYDSGPYSGSDIALEISVNNGTASLRWRHVSGAVAGTAYYTITFDGHSSGRTFTATSATLTNPTAVSTVFTGASSGVNASGFTVKSALNVTGGITSGGTVTGANLSTAGNLSVTGGGTHSIIGNITETGQTISQPSSNAQIPQIMRGFSASQAGDLTQWQDNTGATVYAKVGPTGAATFPTLTATTSITAPNVVYSVTASGNLASSGGQNPAISITATPTFTSATIPTLSGNVAAGGNLTVAGTLGVTGATTLSNTLAVTGAITGQAVINAGRTGSPTQSIQLDGGDAGSIRLTATSSTTNAKPLAIQNLQATGDTASGNNQINFVLGITGGAQVTPLTLTTTGASVTGTLSSSGNVTAPNVVYSVTASGNLASTGGQNPAISITATPTFTSATIPTLSGNVSMGGSLSVATTLGVTSTATFNGNISALGTSTFTSPQFVNAPTTNLGNAGSQTSLISPPFAYGIWNDKFRFTLPSVVEVSNSGTTPSWTTTGAPTAAFVQANILAGRTDLGSVQVTSALPGLRVTWSNTGFAFGQMTNLLFCWTYAFPHVGTITTLWESSADGSIWTSRGTDTRGGLNAVWFAMPVTDHGSDNYFRLTILAPNTPPVAPVVGTATPSGTGGTLAAGTYYYVVTATNANGESSKSAEVTATTTGTTSSVSVSFSNGTGGTAPTSYSLYRGTVTTGENVRVATGASSPLVDTGSAGSAATPPNQASANLRSFQARTGRPGDQGSGEQANLPFNWDGARNVTFLGSSVVVNNGLTVCGTAALAATTHSGTSTFSGASTFNSTIQINNNNGIAAIPLNITNNVDQDIQFHVTVSGAADKYSLISPSGSNRLAFGTNNTERASINSSGVFTATGGFTTPGTLNASGNTTLGGTLGVTGATTLSSTLGVTGTSTLTGLTASGASYFSGRTRAGFNTNASSVTALATSAAEFELSAQSMVTIGESAAGNANPAITMYRTYSGFRQGGAFRILQKDSANNIAFQMGSSTNNGTNSPSYGTTETYVDKWTLDASGNMGVVGNASVGGTLAVTGATTHTGGLSGNTIGNTDGTYFAWDAGSARVGFSKKSGQVNKLAYANSTFAITQYVGQTTIDPANAQTDRLTIDSAGVVTIPGAVSLGSTLSVTGALTLSSALAIPSGISTKDIITGGSGSGIGNLAGATVDTYNLKDASVTSAKLSSGALASQNTPTGSANNTRSKLVRYVAAIANAGSLDTASQKVDNLSTQATVGISRVTDAQAYGGYAIKVTGSTWAGTNGGNVSYGPYYGSDANDYTGSPGLAAGNYRVTVYCKVSSAASGNQIIAFDAHCGTAGVVQNDAVLYTFNASDLGTTYVGASFPMTLLADTRATNGLEIRSYYYTLAGTVDFYISHIQIEQYEGLSKSEVSTQYIKDLAVTNAKINDLSVSKLTAGTITADVTQSGTIRTGPDTGARVLINSGGIYTYSNASTITASFLNTGAVTVTGTINATGGTFTGTVSGGTFQGGTFQTNSGTTSAVRFDSTGISSYNSGSVRTFFVDTAGAMTATSGSIGGFTIGATTLNIGGTSASSVTLDSANGIYLGGTSGAAPFRVSTAGALVATNATVTGTVTTSNITATGGTVGGFTLSSTTLNIGGTTANSITLDSANGIYLGGTSGAAPFRVTTAGALVATNATITGAITATSGSFTGSITSTAGTIGGFTLSSTTLNAGGTTANSVTLDTANGIFLGGTSGAAPFRVTTAGALTATNATITGAITATSGSFTGSITSTAGTIGGFTLSSTTLNAGGTSASSVTLDTANGIFLGGTSSAAPFRVTTAGALTATNATITGAITATSGSFTGTVSTSNITATGGTIGGFTITSTTHNIGGTSANSITLDTANGIFMGGTSSAAPFRVTTAGALTATSATITGTINATGGTFSGSITASGTISGGTLSGATITGGSLNIGSGTFTVSGAGALVASSATITGTVTSSNLTATGGTVGGFTLSSSTLNIGGTTANSITLDSANGIYLGGTSAAAPFRVTTAGALTATSATVTGTINATGGTFSGSITASGTISGGTLSGATISGGSLNIGSGTFTVSSGGALVASSATITGTVTSSNLTATGGTVGGFTLSSTTLNIGGTTASSISLDSANGIYLGGTSAAAPFRVTTAGALTASSATITGTINATGGTFSGSITASGTISGGTISGATLTGGSININSGVFQVNSSGALTATSATVTGNITATGGTIAGFSITGGSGNQLFAGTGATRIMLDTATGITLGSNTNNNTAPFHVDLNGTLTASSANVTGAITATSGTFTGAISASSLTGPLSTSRNLANRNTQANNGTTDWVAVDSAGPGTVTQVGGTGWGGNNNAIQVVWSATARTYSLIANYLFATAGVISAGGTYTVSFYARATAGDTSLTPSIQHTDGTQAIWTGSGITLTASWVRYSYTFKAAQASDTLHALYLTHNNVGTAATWQITGVQVETGSSLSAYSDGQLRVVVDSSGINAYNSAGTAVTTINAATGALSSTSANITGTITASAGTIGGYTIGSSTLAVGSGSTRIVLDSVNGIWLGNNVQASAPFSVSPAGVMTATNATITGTITGSNINGGTITGSKFVGVSIIAAAFKLGVRLA